MSHLVYLYVHKLTTAVEGQNTKRKTHPVLRRPISLNPWKHRPSSCCGAFVYLCLHWINSEAQMATPSPSRMWHQHQCSQLESGVGDFWAQTLVPKWRKFAYVCAFQNLGFFFFFYLFVFPKIFKKSKEYCIPPPWTFCEILFVLPVLVWVLSRYCRFLPQSKRKNVCEAN